MNREKYINAWKGTAEQLGLQLHLGSKELINKLEEQKKEISEWTHSAQTKLENSSSEAAMEVRNKLEELQLQATLGKAETRDALQEQGKKLRDLVSEAKTASEKLLNESKEGAQNMSEEIDSTLDKWHTTFDLLRLQLSLGIAKKKDVWEERKIELGNSIYKFEDELNKLGRESEKSWNNFSNEVSIAWANVKRSFSKTES